MMLLQTATLRSRNTRRSSSRTSPDLRFLLLCTVGDSLAQMPACATEIRCMMKRARYEHCASDGDVAVEGAVHWLACCMISVALWCAPARSWSATAARFRHGPSTAHCEIVRVGFFRIHLDLTKLLARGRPPSFRRASPRVEPSSAAEPGHHPDSPLQLSSADMNSTVGVTPTSPPLTLTVTYELPACTIVITVVYKQSSSASDFTFSFTSHSLVGTYLSDACTVLCSKGIWNLIRSVGPFCALLCAIGMTSGQPQCPRSPQPLCSAEPAASLASS